MTINYTTLLGLAKPVTGTESGAWGDVVNDQITSLLEDAIANAASISVTSGNVTLTDNNGSSDQSRMAILLVTGSPGVSRNVVAPSTSKWYIVKNSSNAAIVLKGSATTGVTIRSGAEALAFWNGSDFELAAMIGPSTSTDNAVARFDGTTGKIVQNSAVTIDDSNVLGGVTQLNVDNLRLDANTISSTNANGNIVLAPNGTGDVQIDADTLRVGDSGVDANIQSNGNADLILKTGNATTGSVTLADGSNGNLTIALNGTGQIIVNAGAVGTPTIAPTGDTNTGIFFPTADTIAFAEGGVEAMRINSSGQLDLANNPILTGGTANGVAYLNASKVLTTGSALTFDGARLAVNGGATSEVLRLNSTADTYLSLQRGGVGTAYIQSAAGAMYLWNQENTAILFGVNNTEQMRLTGTGLGIGTTSPITKLHVLSADGATTSITAGATGRLRTFGYADATRGALLDSINTAENTYLPLTLNGASLLLQTGATTKATLDSSGNLGIGTTSPSVVLHVKSTNGVIYSETTAARGNNNNFLSFRDSTGEAGFVGYGASTSLFYVWNAINDDMVFGTNATQRARITSGGKFLIGTTTSRGTLTVDAVDAISTGDSNSYAITCGNDNVDALAFGSDASFAYIQSFGERPMIINSQGNEVRVGGTTDQGAYNLQCNGTGVWGAGAYVNGSDERLKDNIQTLDDGLAVVTQLRPVTFQYKPEHSKDQSVQPGFIAQELQQAMAGKDYLDGVVQSGPEYLNVAYQNLIPILTKAIQELKTELDSVKTELATLKGA